MKAKTIYAEGFNIRVNLYLLRYFWRQLKNKNVWGANNIYDGILGVYISRQRYARIIEGDPFFLSPEDRKSITGKLGIEGTYFEPGGRILPIVGLNDEDWDQGLEVLNTKDRDMRKKEADRDGLEGYTDVQMKAYVKLTNVLEEQASPKMIEHMYSSDDPLYRISYLFTRGDTYTERGHGRQLMKDLSALSVHEWKSILNDDTEMLKKYRDTLEKHLKYINALLVIRGYEGK